MTFTSMSVGNSDDRLLSQPIFSHYLTIDGNGTNSYNANGNFAAGGSGQQRFFIQPPTGETYYINRLILFVEDGGNFNSTLYGANITLTSGIHLLQVNDDGIMEDFTVPEPILTNAHWGRYMYDIQLDPFPAGNNVMIGRWSFFKAGYPIRLIGNNNERVELLFGDDLTSLIAHTFVAQGYRVVDG